MQSLYNEEQIKNTKYNSKNHTKIIKRHERSQDFFVPIGVYCAICTNLDQLILRIIVKIDATRCQILRLKCTKIVFGWGSAPDPAGGAYSAPSDPLAGLKRPTSKGRAGDMGREGKGRKGGEGRGWEGKGREGEGTGRECK